MLDVATSTNVTPAWTPVQLASGWAGQAGQPPDVGGGVGGVGGGTAAPYLTAFPPLAPVSVTTVAGPLSVPFSTSDDTTSVAAFDDNRVIDPSTTKSNDTINSDFLLRKFRIWL